MGSEPQTADRLVSRADAYPTHSERALSMTSAMLSLAWGAFGSDRQTASTGVYRPVPRAAQFSEYVIPPAVNVCICMRPWLVQPRSPSATVNGHVPSVQVAVAMCALRMTRWTMVAPDEAIASLLGAPQPALRSARSTSRQPSSTSCGSYALGCMSSDPW
jgi:hypothetical protein